MTKNELRANNIKKALKAAFPNTIPILAGYLFLGFSYGLYMHVLGFSFIYPVIMALVIFGGSLEFVAATMLLAPFAPVQTFIMSFVIQARHLFYGIAMLDKFKDMGWKRFYLIFGLSDETFSVNYSMNIPSDCDKGWTMFFVTLLNQIYWVAGAALGALIGGVITFNTNGLEFVMTAMFVVIFMDQLMKEEKPYTGIIGVVCAVACLLIFGRDNFMIPTMICMIVALFLLRKPIEKNFDIEKD